MARDWSETNKSGRERGVRGMREWGEGWPAERAE